MDWRILATTFAAVFLAEMGDKTQIATMSLAAGSSRWPVFLGAALALICTTAIAVAVGEAVSRVIPPVWIRRGAGALFLALGAIYLFGSQK